MTSTACKAVSMPEKYSLFLAAENHIFIPIFKSNS